MRLPTPQMPSRISRAAFSLVELLAVMAIVGIILGIVMPALSGMGRATALVTAGDRVNSMAGLARQRAMSRNTLTALLVLTNLGTEADYRALAVVEYKPGTGWSQVGGWELLPMGITVDAGDPQECSFLVQSPNPFPFLSAIGGPDQPLAVFQNLPVGPGGFAARIFTPGGGLQNPGRPAQIRLVEGRVEEGRIRYTNRNDAGKPANFFDIAIVGATGATKVSRP